MAANVEQLTLLGSAERGTGNNLKNFIRGTTGNNKLQGMEGDDTLLGENGEDELLGGNGNDVLIGGDLGGIDDRDSMTGGSGSDRFVVNHGDQIFDLSDLEDTIDFNQVDANKNTALDDAFVLVEEFTGAPGEMRAVEIADGTRTYLLGNTDSVSGAELEIFMSGRHGDFSSFIL